MTTESSTDESSTDHPSLRVRPWPDQVIDSLGHHPCDDYVERFWLAHLGPSSTLLMRRLSLGFDACPEGFELDLTVTAEALGLGRSIARNGPMRRSIGRLCRYGLAVELSAGEIAVRRRVPPLSRRLLRRLPEDLRVEHDRFMDAAASAA